MTDNLGYYGSGGVSAQGAYSANHYDRHGYNYGPAFFDATHNFSWSGTYDLPVGKGHSWGSNWHPAVNAVLGGWGLSTIISAHTGFPLTISTTDRSLQNPRGTARPDQLGKPSITSNPDCYISNPLNLGCAGLSGTVACAAPALGTFGNAGRNSTEQKYLDVRAEVFPFTPPPSFNPPDRLVTVTSLTFGQITGTASPPRIIEFALKLHF